MIILSTLFQATVATASELPIIWWRTQSGEVTEDRDPVNGRLGCWLFLYDGNRSVVVNWQSGDGGEWLSISDPAVNFGDGHDLPVVVQIGQHWVVEDHALIAHVRKSMLVIHLTQDIEPLLADAEQVHVMGEGIDTTVVINHRKMPALLKAVNKCQASPAIQRG